MRARRAERRWLATALLAFAFAAAQPEAAAAQPGRSAVQKRADRRALARSERLLRRAVRLCDRAAYARALRLFERARSLPLAHFYLGRCHEAREDAPAASEAYRKFLEVAPAALQPEAAAARDRLTVLEPPPPAEPAPPPPAVEPVVAEPAPAAPSHAGATALPPRPRLRAQRTAEPPAIDGVLEPREWPAAAGGVSFTQKLPFGGQAPSDPTTLQLIYDDESLYIAFDCEQRNSPLTAPVARRDRPTESDSVSIAIDPRGDGRSAYEFTVSAAGVLVDGIRFDDGKIAREWDAVWEARATPREGGWAAELRIPLRALRFDASADARWRIQARRYVAVRQELDEWAYIPRGVGGEVAHYGSIDGLQLTASGATFEAVPFLVGRARHKSVDPALAHAGWTLEPSAGLDFAWRPSEDVALGGTINPDFAQVEADRLILNLTNVELAFPEKRPFFLAGMDDFATMVPIFYSRRVGRAPVGAQRVLGPNERLYDDAEPAPIYGALKLAADLDDAWTVAALSALTGPNEVLAAGEAGSREPRLLDPLTSYNVLRVRSELDDGFDLGATATATLRNEPGFGWPAALTTEAAYVPADPGAVRCPGGAVVYSEDRCFHDAFVGSVDVTWRSASGDYAVRGQGYASAIVHGPTRILADGTAIGSGDLGAGGTLRVSKQGGEHWLFDGTFAAHGRKLDVNDLGFLERQNSLRAGLYLEYRTLEPWHAFLETHTALLGYGENDLDGLALGRGLMLLETITLENHWTVTLGGYATATRFDDREVGDGTALERAGLLGAAQSLSTDPSQPFVVAAQVAEEGYAGGMSLNAQLTLAWQPTAALELQLVPAYASAAGEPRFAGFGALDRELVFGRLRAESAGVTLRVSYGFSPSLTLQTYGQLFLARGDYADFSRFVAGVETGGEVVRLRDLVPSAAPPVSPDFERASLALNVVLRWEYRLGSTLYLLYLRSQDPSLGSEPSLAPRLDLGLLRGAPATDVLMVKFSYLLG